MKRLDRLLRALLLASDKPVGAAEVVELLDAAVDEEEWPERVDPDTVEAAMERIAALTAGSGIELCRVSGGWRYRTEPDLGDLVRRLWPDRVLRLSRAALEALSVVAYRQPCTRAEVEDVRGVDCGGVMKSLLERKMIKVLGRKDEPGRPLLYGTTPEFLESFGLDSLKGLPTLRDLESLRAEEANREKGNVVDEDPDQSSVPAASSPSSPIDPTRDST